MPSASSIITPLGPSKSTCGYCGPTGGRSAASSSLCTATLDASRLSCQVCQAGYRKTNRGSQLRLGISGYDRQRLAKIRNVLLQARSKTLLLSKLYDQVRYLVHQDLLHCHSLTRYRRLNVIEFNTSKSQRKLLHRCVNIANV